MLDFAFSKDTLEPNPIDGRIEKPLSFRAGKIVRIFGPSARNCCATLLEDWKKMPIAWLDSELNSLPSDLAKKRIDWKKVLLIHGEEDIEWALSFVVRSGVFPIIVFRSQTLSAKKLGIFREKLLRANAMLILLSDANYSRSFFDEEFFAFEHSHFLAFPGGEG